MGHPDDNQVVYGSTECSGFRLLGHCFMGEEQISTVQLYDGGEPAIGRLLPCACAGAEQWFARQRRALVERQKKWYFTVFFSIGPALLGLDGHVLD